MKQTTLAKRSPVTARVALLAVHLLLPLAALALTAWQPWWSLRNVFRVVLFAEAGMLSVWAVLSSHRVLFRVGGWLAGLLVCLAMLSNVDSRQPQRKLVESLFLPSAATIAFAVAIKSSPALRDETGSGRWQFTVGQLLIITTTIAVWIAALQRFWKGSLIIDPRLIASEGAQISIVMVMLAVLPRRLRWVRLSAACVVICAVGVTVQSFMSESWFWDTLRNLRSVSAYQIWEDLVSIPLATLLESFLAAATFVLVYGDRDWNRKVRRRFASFAVIPAAGVSARMGEPKLLLPLDGTTLIERTIRVWKASGVDHVYVVVRADDTALTELVRASGAAMVNADPPPADMKASIAAGLAYIALNEQPRPQDVWLTAPADLPSLNQAVVRRLLEAYDVHSPRVLVAAHEDRAGHPMLFPWSWATKVSEMADDEGLNRLIERAGATLVECGPAAVGADIDTPDDYQRWKSGQR